MENVKNIYGVSSKDEKQVKRTTLIVLSTRIPIELNERLINYSKSTGISKKRIIIDAIDNYLLNKEIKGV